uniref:Bm7464 n=1 Tax=Brugia malayi TaxID=6279 RepID=A0A0J9Y2R0_BRUMA|nr:Bm7464 [Brugia malayi]
MLLPVMLFLMEAVSGQQQSAIDSSCSEYTIPFSFQSDKTGNPSIAMLFQPFGRNDKYCTGEIQWTVGLLLEDDGNNIKAKWKCCNYEGLRHARAMKTVIVKADESYAGGEVYQDGRRVAFDLIKEVYLLFDEQLSTILEDDNFDDLFLPRHRMTHRRMFSRRRRPFYRPVAEDYDYYDYDPVILKRPSVHRRYHFLDKSCGNCLCSRGEDTTVQTPDQIKRIDELQVGDQVLSIEESLISYSPVVMFLHRSDNESITANTFLEFQENGEIIKLTDYHLLYVTSCAVGENLRLIFAKDVQLGHCLHVVKNQSNNLVPVEVSNIQRSEICEFQLTGKGFYAPLTANGDIIVNSILSSCHSNVAVQTLQQSIFNFLRKFRYLISTDQNTDGLLPGIQFLTQISDLFLPYSIV